MTENLITNVTDATYGEIVEKSELPVCFIVGAPWCQDCRRIAPLVNEFAGRYAGRVLFAYAYFDENPSIKARFEMQHIPSIFIIKKGVIEDRLIEPKAIAPFRDFIESHLK